MLELKKKFCSFLLQNQVLLFGDFVTKSKRKSPYFLNFGNIYTAASLRELAYFYLEIIKINKLQPTNLFGPAYKGIPITLACSLYYQAPQATYSFNRKEEKKHGDKGILVGKNIDAQDKVIIFDDVITAGISFRESATMLQERGATIIAGIIGVDRMEKGRDKKATAEISEEFGFPIYSIITIEEIITTCYQNQWLDQDKFNLISKHLEDKRN